MPTPPSIKKSPCSPLYDHWILKLWVLSVENGTPQNEFSVNSHHSIVALIPKTLTPPPSKKTRCTNTSLTHMHTHSPIQTCLENWHFVTHWYAPCQIAFPQIFNIRSICGTNQIYICWFLVKEMAEIPKKNLWILFQYWWLLVLVTRAWLLN